MATAVVTSARKVYAKKRRQSQHMAQRLNLLPNLFERQQGKCFWCGDLMVMRAFYDHTGQQIADPHKATLDHVVPFSVEGPTNDKNCVAACRACNELRAEYNTASWRREMSKKDSQLRAYRNLEAWMTQQLHEEREHRRAAEDAAAMHLATIEMEGRPESGWIKRLRRLFW